MQQRPWPLVVLAVFQLLTPLFNILFNAWFLHVSPQIVTLWLFQRPTLEIFEALALMPIAGISIYLMKRWSYIVFFIALIWSTLGNLRYWDYAINTLPHLSLIMMMALNLGLVTYFLLPAVRITYFNPKVRWWESKPRYPLQLPIKISKQTPSGTPEHGPHYPWQFQGTVQNISESGIFLQYKEGLALNETIRIGFDILGQWFEVSGVVVHQRRVNTGDLCYGIQFLHNSETARRFGGLAKALKFLGFQSPATAQSRLRLFTDWLKRLLTTGKGLLPEVRTPQQKIETTHVD